MPGPHNSRSRFLEQAARHYAISSPATSAFIMHQRQTELESQPTGTDRRPTDDACKACGSIFLPGSKVQTKISSGQGKPSRSPKRRRNLRKHGNADARTDKHIVTTCLNCHRYTKRALPRESRKSNEQPMGGDITVSGVTGTAAPSVSNAKNASSKQRTKARKEGLRSLLERDRKISDSANPGLDLMDLMKKS